MLTLSYGFKKPQVTDLGATVFPAIEANWQQVNDHNHNGTNSAKIDSVWVLPDQVGNTGKFLTTNGSIASWAAVPGESNTASNVGAGNGLFKQKSGVDLQFKTLVAGTNVTITPVGDTFVIDSIDTGESNTASNIGGGNGLFSSKVGVDLQFKTLVAGTNVTITPVGNTYVIASSGGGGGGITAGIYAKYHNSTGVNYIGGSVGTWYNVVMDTLIEDASSIYNPSNGILKIPSGYVGVARGRARLYYFLNSSPQNPTLMMSSMWSAPSSTFLKYGSTLTNNAGTNLANGFLYADFEFSGVANDQFYFSFYANSSVILAGAVSATRIEIEIFPK